MLLSRSVGLAILAALGAQGLVIPSAENVIQIFTEVAEGEALKSLEHGDERHGGMKDGRIGHAVYQPGRGAGPGAEAPAQGTTDEDEFRKLKEQVENSDGMAEAPIVNANGDREIIPHRYIVVFKEGLTAEEINFHQEVIGAHHANHLAVMAEDDEFILSMREAKVAGGILDSFNVGAELSGYFGYFTDKTIEFIRRNPLVKYVEQDSVVHANEFSTEKGAPWGLARVSHREPLSLSSFNQYLYDDEAGSGVTSYVIDTGINIKHKEFGGRAKWGATIPTGDSDEDGNGHGTHCAGTIGSQSYGVAKNVQLRAVKVLRSNGSGSMSDVVKGVEYAAQSHQKEVKANKKGFKGSTANMSLGGGKSPALDAAVNAAVKLGLNFAVAAGNENQDACNSSPASAENAVTVGASTISDDRAYFSNYGKCVDIFGPGLNILSTYIGSDSATATLSGTSMASPHIAGLLSYFLSLQPGSGSEFAASGSGVTPAELKKNLINFGTKNILSDIPDDGTPNILGFNGAGKNLTAFWGTEELDSGTKLKFSKGLHDLEDKVNELINMAEHDAEDLISDISDLVYSVYDNLKEYA